MIYLRRNLAPISPRGWEEIEGEAKGVLTLNLAGRRLVDFTGPLGWEAAGVNLGRTQSVDPSPVEGVRARLRRSLPMVELESPFSLPISEMRDLDRGAEADLDPVTQAARKLAQAEDDLIFNGFEPGGITGIINASPYDALTISTEFKDYPKTVARALETLRQAGIPGPYSVALGSRCYTGLTQAVNEGGYPLLKAVQALVDGSIVRAPQVNGAVVMSTAPGNYELYVGQDVSVAYCHDEPPDTAFFYLIESVTFRVREPAAAVSLVYKA